jgi:adenosylcobinamide kinase/adenosylcobinamide-phosphate guanylyltransferase
LILITGGVRTGKSDYAQRLGQELGGDAVTFIATARVEDEDMRSRIARHRAKRPAGWITVESPLEAPVAVRKAATEVILLDCLTMFCSNIMLAGSSGHQATMDAVDRAVGELLVAMDEREGKMIVVTNEVGSGVVPASDLGRWFRDALGLANQRLAAIADQVVLLVSGIPVQLKASDRS